MLNGRVYLKILLFLSSVHSSVNFFKINLELFNYVGTKKVILQKILLKKKQLIEAIFHIMKVIDLLPFRHDLLTRNYLEKCSISDLGD